MSSKNDEVLSLVFDVLPGEADFPFCCLKKSQCEQWEDITKHLTILSRRTLGSFKNYRFEEGSSTHTTEASWQMEDTMRLQRR